MKFKIEYGYRTGDSFGNEDHENETLPYEFSKYETAEENLNRIVEHYETYCRLDSYRISEDEAIEIQLKAMEKPWYVHEKDWCDNWWKYSIKLVDDNGNEFRISPNWIGYFEKLNYIKIAVVAKEVHFN
jgi:hypothetical protein